ncbi:MAG: phage portal protein [Muribaculaceae bacterium]|nr:phage portal protein [Muribaculaceae bacterium]
MDVDVWSIPGSRDVALVTMEADCTGAPGVHEEDGDICPVTLAPGVEYVPWGRQNSEPFRLMRLVGADETMRTCMDFISECTAAAGLEYRSAVPDPAADSFFDMHDLDSLWIGQCVDMCAFGMSVVELTVEIEPTPQPGEWLKTVTCARRLEAAYCRLSRVDAATGAQWLHYADWSKAVSTPDDIRASMPVITSHRPEEEIDRMVRKRILRPGVRKVAFLVRMPQAAALYYPVPAYTSLFRSGWYTIKQLVTTARLSKLKNSASIKYHVQISSQYWRNQMMQRHITDPRLQEEWLVKMKGEIVDFLTGVENSGKTIFSEIYTTPDGKPVPGVTISKVDDSKEGGDWTMEIQEAVNMICFAMRVHSNLVGSVPGKSQSNNSGSDKRELYTIAQALRTPLRKLLLAPHRLICRLNGWAGVSPQCPILQLTTLDEHRDIKSSDTQNDL